MDMLKLRVLTAIILIPVFITLLFTLSSRGFSIFTGLIVLGCAWEWSSLMGLKKYLSRFFYLTLILALQISLLYLFYQQTISVLMIFNLALAWWLIAAVLVVTYPKSQRLLGKGIMIRGLMGILVLIPCWVALIFIHMINHGEYVLLFLFILIWGADTGAYFAGKKWGKNKLLPLVSPGKTWQGLFGALLTTVVIVFIAGLLFNLYSDLVSLLLLSLVTVLFSVLGDLFESMLKRHVGVKDSGKLLPGHGGILDRIDSLTAAAPIFALGILWLS